MRYGNRTEAAQFGDPDAMLARFEPGPERVARLVLHPRLSFVPCAADDFEAFAATFAVDVPARILTAEDVIAARTSGTGTADITNQLDTAIEAVLSAREQQDATSRRVVEADARLQEAQAGLERVADQRAQVAEAVSEARQRLAWLERADVSETELQHNVDTARSEVAEAVEELARVSDRANDGGPELREAKAALEKAERELRRIEADGAGGGYALDEAAHQLELWAAQRAFDLAEFDLERLRKLSGTEDAQIAVDAAQERLDAGRARLEAAERALAERTEAGLPDDPAAEAAAIRSQIEAVERSLGEAEAAREAEVANLEQEASAARRDGEAADRQLERALERIDGAAPDQDIDEVVAELRARREQLTADDSGLSEIGRVLRDLALDAPEPLLVFIDPVAEPNEDLVGALISVSGLKRTVVVTDKTEMLHEAREMEPALGAVREPLETGGGSRQELARSDGNRT